MAMSVPFGMATAGSCGIGKALSGSPWDSFGPPCLGRGRDEQQTLILDPQNLCSPGRRGSMTEHLQDGPHPRVDAGVEIDEETSSASYPIHRDPWQGPLEVVVMEWGTCTWLSPQGCL